MRQSLSDRLAAPDKALSMSERWLAKHRAEFASHDGLPGEFHREVLFNQIKPQAMVAIVDRRGQVRQGRVVMHSSHGGWVLNMGGAHGTPGLVDARNCVFVAGAHLPKPGKAPQAGYGARG
jgi:hypothetical protein